MALVSMRTSLPLILALSMVAGCGGQADEATGTVPAAVRVDNPFAGVKGYVNPEWKAHALAESGGDRVANVPTAIWLRTIASITGASGGTSLQQHLDNALAQGAGYIEVVLHDLPGRDCTSWSVNTELQASDLSTYQSQFVDPIAAIEANSKYATLRIINIIEPKSLAYLVTNVSSSRCSNVQTSSDYVGGIQYALGKLGAIPNAYNYLDIAHHGVLGWDQNLTAAVTLYAKTIQGATGGFGTVAGFVSNVANYSATVEPFFQASTTVNGTPVRQSKWVDYASYVDEQSFDLAWRSALVSSGASSSIGMLIDTSRNGWGGSARPKAVSTSTDVNTFVDQSRIDRRTRVDNWCNQSGAGLGERPQVVGANGIQAYVWIKAPGESDGASSVGSDGKGVEPMCNPAYDVVPDGALPSAPIENAWFSSEFQELMANAYPPLDAVPTTDTTPPSAPTGLAVSNMTTRALILSWNASTDDVAVVAYDVYSGSTIVGSAQVTTTTVGNLQPNVSYTFTVRARDAAGNVSARSASMTVTIGCTCDTMPPTVPTGLTYTNLSYSGVTLRWAASTDNVGVTGYEILDGGVVIGTSQTTQFDVSGLLPGTTHSFSVRALDAYPNRSSASTPVTVTTPKLTVPNAPANLRWTASGGTVELCWDAPDGWSQLDSYDLFFGSFNLGSFGDTCVDLIGFKPGTPYGFTVKTVDASGNASVASNAVTVLLNLPPGTTAPTAPTNLAAVTASTTSVRLTWNASTDDVRVVLYQIYSSGSLLQTVAASTAATVTGLATNSYYTFTVKAVDAAGNVSAASNAVPIYVGSVDGEPPGPPTNVHVTGVTATSVSLAWTAGTDAVGVILYQVIANGTILLNAPSTSVTVPNLTTGTAYTFTVRSVDAMGWISAASDPVGAMPGVGPIDPQLPAAPTGVSVTCSYRGGSCMLSWAASTGSVPAVAYKVYDAGVGPIVTTTLTSAPLTGYGTGTTHTFTVRAVDAAGDLSVASASARYTLYLPADASPPSDPTNLKVTATTSSSVSLAWSPSSDNQGVVGYDIYTDGILVGISRATTATISNLAARPYTFDVRARDAAGNLSIGADVTVTPGTAVDPGGDPTAPGNLRIADGGPGTAVMLSWDPPVSGGTVTGYEVYERYPQKDYLIASTAITSAIVSAAGGGVVPFYVKAIHGSGSASTSALVTIIFPDTGDPVPLTAITQLKATATTGTTVALTWSSISSPCNLWYEIYANSVLVGITTSAAGAVSNLTAGSTYAVTVNAIDSCADTSSSNGSVTVTMPR